MAKDRKLIFFGYESNHQDISDAIKRACKDFNTHQRKYDAITWEDLGPAGQIINRLILDTIDRCDIFACDLTHLNFNVLFELGYAIGKRKRILIFLNNTERSASSQYGQVKALRNIGYVGYSTHKQILSALQNKRNQAEPVLLDHMQTLRDEDRDTRDVFYSNRLETQASLELAELLYSTSPQLRVLLDSSSEVEYQTLKWYFRALHASQMIVIHLLGVNKKDSSRLNGESSLYAGVACGLGKDVLLLAPEPFRAPIDYEDLLLQYSSSEECAIKAHEWITQRLVARPGVQNDDFRLEREEERIYDLLRLDIGSEVAESEKAGLQKYFIEFEAYRKAADKNLSIFIGRKGTGKTALFLRLQRDLDVPDTNTLSVILAPESQELIDEVDMVNLYSSEASKGRFLYAVWRLIIFSKILLGIQRKIRKKERKGLAYIPTDEEVAVLRLCEEYKSILSLNFFGVVNKIHEENGGRSGDFTAAILESLYSTLLSKTIRTVKEYIAKQTYLRVFIVADNLDKAWEAKNDLTRQSEMILSLLEFDQKIVSELGGGEGSVKEITVNTVLLLRKDIFEYVLRKAREPDKLQLRTYEIDWARTPTLLRQLVEERFRVSLDMKPGSNVDSVWQEYFEIGEDPFNVVKHMVVSRPRDVIYFFGQLFSSALDNNRSKVTLDDLQVASDAYDQFLYSNLVAEMNAEFPEIAKILGRFQKSSRARTDAIPYRDFRNYVLGEGYTEGKLHSLIDSLYAKQYFSAINRSENDQPIESLGALIEAWDTRRWGIFRKQIFVFINPGQRK